MPAPAYASAYRQQQQQQQGEYGGPSVGSETGYNIKQQQPQQGAYTGGAGQGQGQELSGHSIDEYARYGNSNKDNNNTIQNMMASGSSNGYGGPSSYASRSNQFYQQQQQQQSRAQLQQQDDVQSSFGGSAYMTNNGGGPGAGSVIGNGLPSPTSTSGANVNGGPSSSSQSQSAPKGNSPEDIENSRRIAKIHFTEFKAYLDAEGQRDPNARANAREKLTRLTRPQFQELSTDVYDELMRRQRAINAPEGTAPEYLPQKPEFHPKRNQAREKLSTLPKTRFRDLASDVYFELERRYPEFKEPEVPGEDLNGYDAPNGNIGNSSTSSRGGAGAPGPQRSASRDEGSRFQMSNGQPQQQQRRPQFPQGKPSMDGQQQQQYQNQTQGQNAGSAANEVIIPNKSKVVEEEINLPGSNSSNALGANNMLQSGQQQQQQQRGYGNYANQNGMGIGRKSSERERGINGMTAAASPGDFDAEPVSPSNSQSALTQSQASDPIRRPSNEAPRIGNANGPQLGATSPDWSSSFARASEASSLGTRLIGGYGASTTPSEGGLRGDWESDEIEKLKSDYEYKIATMQNRLQGLEKDLRDAQDASQKAAAEATRAANAENELAKLKERHEDALSNIDQLEQELAEAQDKVSVPAYQAPVSRAEDQEEITRLQRELDSTKTKYNSQVDATENLRKEIEGLVDTLKEMNLRQDQLANERDEDQARIKELLEEAKEWKGRYEAAKTELREIKTTSQLFVKPTKADDDYMPTSPNGAILDSHVTRFQSSIDDLLISGRSDAPSSVIIATKQVINAVARIDEDVQEYESTGFADSLSPDDRERLMALKSKCNATLSNLTTAARNHATGHGLSPVSLLDAAASHLSNTIIELVRLVAMRKAGTNLSYEGSSSTSMKQSLSSSISSSSLANQQQQHHQHQHQRTPSFASSSQMQSRGLPTRLASLKREEDAISVGQSGVNGSSGRSSSASNRSRTVTNSDRTQASSIEEPSLKTDTSISSGLSNAFGQHTSRQQQQQQINPSGSDTSLASNFRPDPRRNAGQHSIPPSFDSQSSLRSQLTDDSKEERKLDRPDFGEDGDQDDARDYAQEREQEGSREAPDPSRDPEAWAELKSYLEQQTEAIVHSITALLAAIRGGAQPAKLQENLSQIITIVSTVVQILQDNLPPSLHEDSEPIIQDLSQNCQKLIDLQSPTDGSPQTFSKQTKQAMATASFGVAKSLKSVNSLLASV